MSAPGGEAARGEPAGGTRVHRHPVARRGTAERVTVVVVTRNRRASLLRTLERLERLDDRVPIVVVDNASSDGTPEAVERAHPDVRLLRLDSNAGAAGRNRGAEAARTPYVAFSDDDSWWASGALTTAADLLDAHPRVALLAARIHVGPDERLEEASSLMARSPLDPPTGMEGRGVLGFVSCGAVVRRSAFLHVGGFAAELAVGGEEDILALDLAAAGWALVYRDELVAYHHPAAERSHETRRRVIVRNALETAWLRRPLRVAARETVKALALGVRERTAREAVFELVRRAPRVARERRPLPRRVEAQRALLDTE